MGTSDADVARHLIHRAATLRRALLLLL
jgi:hypothetical protein